MKPSVFELQRDFYADRPIMLEHNQNVHALLSLLMGEVGELSHEILANGYDPEKIASEASDVALFAHAIIMMLGLDPEQQIREKLARNQAKYPAVVFQSGDYKEARATTSKFYKDRDMENEFYERN